MVSSLHKWIASSNWSLLKVPSVWDAKILPSQLSNTNINVALMYFSVTDLDNVNSSSFVRKHVTAANIHFMSIPASKQARHAAFTAEDNSWKGKDIINILNNLIIKLTI